MADLDRGYIPRNLDKPPKILIWELDIAIVFFFPLWFVGFIMQKIIIALILSFALSFLFKRVKSSSHPRFLRHLLYWYLPTGLGGLKMKSIPPSHERNFHS